MFKPIISVVETIVKLALFLHSDVFIAFGSFLLIWTITFNSYLPSTEEINLFHKRSQN